MTDRLLNNRLRLLAYGGLGMALVAVGTIVIHIPMPGTEGYVNVGDTFIFLIAATFGPLLGLIAGGFGSALADLILGYPHWAPFTLVIKGLEGLLVGWLLSRTGQTTTSRPGIVTVLVYILGAVWMVLGYTVVEIFIYGWGAALGSIPGNSLQGGVSVVLGWLLTVAVRRVLPASWFDSRYSRA
ncbi:MAG: ECF transporter S component [Limnochordales bacterium]|nr:ECF transporter S component [Limnochordales bacterium]